MDSLDYGIIDLLRQNARAGYGDIGEVIGLSASAVKRRVDRLVADKVIRGFTIQVDPAVADSVPRPMSNSSAAGLLRRRSCGASSPAFQRSWMPALSPAARMPSCTCGPATSPRSNSRSNACGSPPTWTTPAALLCCRSSSTALAKGRPTGLAETLGSRHPSSLKSGRRPRGARVVQNPVADAIPVRRSTLVSAG